MSGKFGTVLIDGGLDLLTGKVGINPGTLTDCLNYEVAIKQGITRMDGYERFDGGASPSYYSALLKLTLATISITGPDIPAGSVYKSSDFVAPDLRANFRFVLVNRLTPADLDGLGRADVYVYITVPDTTTPQMLYDLGNVYNFSVDGGLTDVISLLAGRASPIVVTSNKTTVALDLTNRAAVYTGIRSSIQEVPGQGNILGLCFFKDFLYAVRDYPTITYSGGTNEPDPGDEVFVGGTYATATAKGYVAKVRNLLGSWGGTNNALGKIMLYNITGTFTTSTLKNHTKGDITVSGITAVGLSNGAVAEAAGLYKATGTRGSTFVTASWQHQDLGWNVGFQTGVAAFTTINTATANSDITTLIQSTQWRTASTAGTLGNWGSGVGAYPASISTNDGDASYVGYTFLNGQPTTPNNQFQATNLGFTSGDIPTGAIITGIELEITRKAVQTGATGTSVVDGNIDFLGLGDDHGFAIGDSVTPWDSAGVYVAKTYGGKQVLHGYVNVTPAEIISTSFGFSIGARVLAAIPALTNWDARVTMVRVRVHYLPPRPKVYFYNSTLGTAGSVVADVVMYYTTAGTFTGGDAKGILYLANVGTNRRILSNDKIYTYPADPTTPLDGATGGITLLANTASRADHNVMDWAALTTSTTRSDASPASKYEFTTANFYARDGLEAIYGCSGGGPAFYYDGNSFSRIRTGYTDAIEKPRHVTAHQSQLILGYFAGTTQISDAGTPLSFSGLNGSAEIGVQSPVTGVFSLNGDALAIFTRTSVLMVQGVLASAPYVSVVSPRLGAIEYTCQSMGQFLYTSFRGSQTLETVKEYGDFKPSPHSQAVWDWLRPRVQSSAFFEASATGVINSLSVKNKAQYRLYFADGYVLTSTFLRDGEEPQYTFQKYTDSTGFVSIFCALCSGTETLGRDRLFAANSDGTGYVYELDRGNSFDGFAINAYAVMSVNDLQAPYVDKNFFNIQLHGFANDYASFTCTRSPNYEVIGSAITVQNPSIPHVFGANTVTPTGISRPYFSVNVMQLEGRGINIRFNSNTATEFPHTIQALSMEVAPLAAKKA